MSLQPVNQNGKKGKRESNRQNKKKYERRYTGKNKIHTLQNDKWVRKQYIKKCEGNTWSIKWNYKRNESDTTCSLCQTEEDTAERIMVCQERNNTYNLSDEKEKGWEK